MDRFGIDLGSIWGAFWTPRSIQNPTTNYRKNTCGNILPKDHPKRPQECPKRPQDPSRGLKIPPRGSQDPPKRLPGGSKRDPTPPETPPSDFGNAPRWSHEISLRKDSFDFAIALHDCFACIYNANLEICQKAVKKLQKLSKVEWHSLRASEPPSL